MAKLLLFYDAAKQVEKYSMKNNRREMDSVIK